MIQGIHKSDIDINEIKALITDLRDSIDKFIKEDKRAELSSEIEVLESQIKSPNPKRGIIKEALTSVRNIVEGTTGSLFAAGIQEKVNFLLRSLFGGRACFMIKYYKF